MSRDPRPTTERALMKAVMELLQSRGFIIFRRNTGAVRARYVRKDGSSRERFIRFSEPGAADLYGWQIGTGRHVEIEIKRPGLKPSTLQAQWLAQAEKDGCMSFWCDSMGMAERELHRLQYG